jgi:hypothetical protein
VAGALILLGLTQGDAGHQEPQARSQVKQVARRFLELFQQRQGSIVCRQLLGVDPSTEEGQRQALENDLFQLRCPEMVATAGQVLEEVLTALPGRD